MTVLGESGIDVASDTIENIVDAVAPVVAGPIKGKLLSTGIKTVRGFVDRIQKGSGTSNSGSVHTNRYYVLIILSTEHI